MYTLFRTEEKRGKIRYNKKYLLILFMKIFTIRLGQLGTLTLAFVFFSLFILSGCSSPNTPQPQTAEKREEKISYTYNDFSFNYPKEWGNVDELPQDFSSQGRGKSMRLEFSEKKNSEGETTLPTIEIFDSNYKVSPPYPGEEKTTEVDYVHIHMNENEETIAKKMLTPIVQEASVKKMDIAGKKALFVKEKWYYWGITHEGFLYVFPEYNSVSSTLVIRSFLTEQSDLEKIMSELKF